jgi:hypothetical protein
MLRDCPRRSNDASGAARGQPKPPLPPQKQVYDQKKAAAKGGLGHAYNLTVEDAEVATGVVAGNLVPLAFQFILI